jgi:hypothetical protein
VIEDMQIYTLNIMLTIFIFYGFMTFLCQIPNAR